MKKIYLNILAILAISGLTTSQALAVNPILRNSYGADVQFIEMELPSADEYTKSRPYAAKTLENGKQTYLIEEHNRRALSLRTIGGKFTDVSNTLKDLMNQIRNQQQYHFSQTPVITILPSYVFWNLSLSWERR